MPAVLVESNTEVLEDKDDALLPDNKIEEGDEYVDLNASVESTTAAPKVSTPAPQSKEPKKDAPAAQVAEEEELPEELKGKTPAQLAKMYKEAQSVIGRQGSELGEFRKKADQLIHASLANLREREAPAKKEEPKAEPELEETDFFARPKEAIEQAIRNHPVIKELRETLGKSAQEQAIARATQNTERFNAAHPDAGTIMQDETFRNWVASSKVRTELLRRAHERFDFDAGDEVFGTWKALQGAKKPAAEVVTDGAPDDAAVKAAAAVMAKRKQALKDAAAPSGGNAAPKETGGKKIYRRADVLKLMQNDPDRYEALAPEIEKAYREGRVR